MKELYKSLKFVRELDASPSEKSVLYALCSRIDSEYKCFPSRRKLCMDSGIKDKSTMSKITKRLRERSLITVTNRSNKDGQTSNIYRINVCAESDFKSSGKMIDSHGGSSPKALKLPNTNYSIKKEESSIEEDGNACSHALQDKNPSFEEGGGKASNYPVSSKFLKSKSTPKAIVFFWFSCQRMYFCNSKINTKAMPKKQYESLLRIFSLVTKSLYAFQVIEYSFKYWSYASKFAMHHSGLTTKPKSPSPVWMETNFFGLIAYWIENNESY